MAREYKILSSKYDFELEVKVNERLREGWTLVGGEWYIVSDRMNRRYGKKDFDIFVESYEECIELGRQNLEIKIEL